MKKMENEDLQIGGLFMRLTGLAKSSGGQNGHYGDLVELLSVKV